uniref:Putative secreted protein n=1 Tax=Anopheles darlingi TaxID=43151 RepID=A0A2M4D9T6_ANODA
MDSSSFSFCSALCVLLQLLPSTSYQKGERKGERGCGCVSRPSMTRRERKRESAPRTVGRRDCNGNATGGGNRNLGTRPTLVWLVRSLCCQQHREGLEGGGGEGGMLQPPRLFGGGDVCGLWKLPPPPSPPSLPWFCRGVPSALPLLTPRCRVGERSFENRTHSRRSPRG